LTRTIQALHSSDFYYGPEFESDYALVWALGELMLNESDPLFWM
jgi:hypothetical protein